MDIPAFIHENTALAGMTTFGIGGPARGLAEPAVPEELIETLVFARERRLPVRVLGVGSNLLVADAGIEALVVRLARSGHFARLERLGEGDFIWRVGAALPLQKLVAATAGEGAAGLESLAGIPGTVGGAVTMNAGASEGGIGRFVVEAEVYDSQGVFHRIPADDLGFRYRGSDIGDRVAVAFIFRFSERDDPESLRLRARECRERKRTSQPLTVASAGCVFKNPRGDFAGALLEGAGCKGMTEGGAAVSALHANFIVNVGGARARDVALLAVRMRDAVHRKAGIRLEPEIRLWGEEPIFSAFSGGAEHVDT